MKILGSDEFHSSWLWGGAGQISWGPPSTLLNNHPMPPWRPPSIYILWPFKPKFQNFRMLSYLLYHSPFPSWLCRQAHTSKVEPLNGTLEKNKSTESQISNTLVRASVGSQKSTYLLGSYFPIMYCIRILIAILAIMHLVIYELSISPLSPRWDWSPFWSHFMHPDGLLNGPMSQRTINTTTSSFKMHFHFWIKSQYQN